MRKRWLWILLALLAVLLIAKHFLLDTPALATEKYRIDLDALHRVATASGPLPSNIEVENLSASAIHARLVPDFALPRVSG